MTYEFSSFRLDVDRLELYGPGGRIAAEPLVLEFLAHLVRHRDRVVGKEELTREVWHAWVVSDAALTRCASESRRLLGDRDRPHRFIETVYGRGYRFAAPVTRIDPLAPEIATEIGPEIGPPSGPPPGHSRARLVAASALAALLLVALWFVASKRAAVSSSPPPPDADRSGVEAPLAASGTLAVTWSAPGDRPELRLVALSLADLLANAISTRPGPILTASPAYVPDLRPSTVARVSERLGSDRLVHLEVLPAPTDGFARVEARLIDASSAGSPTFSLGRYALPTPTEDGDDLERHIVTRDSVLDELASSLRITFGDAGDRVESLPHDPLAWRLYLDARSNFSVSCSDRRAIASLERSVELDPGFAPAWNLLAGARLSEINLCEPGRADYGPVREAVDRAIENAGDWSAPFQLRASLSLYTGDVETAYQELLEALDRFPTSFFVRLRSADVLRYAGFLERSTAEFERALALWPAAMKLTDTIPYPYLYRGDWDRFLASLSGMESPYFRYYRGWAELWRGDRERAIEALEPASREHPEDLFSQLSRALLAILADRAEEAEEVLTRLAAQRSASGPGDGEVTYKVGQLLALAGRDHEALEQLALAVEQGFFCARCIELDPAFETLRASPELDRVLARARDRHLAFARRFELATEIEPTALASLGPDDGPP